jgi:hypothetical protein
MRGTLFFGIGSLQAVINIEVASLISRHLQVPVRVTSG